MEIDYQKYPKLRVFETHGVEFSGQRGEELYGNCPFTDKPDKFYVNRKTGLWDSKTAGMSGNVQSFLFEIQEEYKSNFDVDQRKQLAEHRSFPAAVLAPWELGWTGSRVTIPIKDYAGKLVDIRMYDMRRKVMRSTAGCRVGLLGAHLMSEHPAWPVYVCEGEWDMMAMHWLLRKTKRDGVAVAVPGAGTFKDDWIRWFNGRRVFALYDHDEPGRKGEQKLNQSIGSVVKQISFCHWPDELPNGFDLRDWIVYGFQHSTLEVCVDRLHKLFKRKPRRAGLTVRTESGQQIRLVGKVEAEAVRPEVVPTLGAVHETYRKWLHLPNTDAIDVMLATALSQRMDGPPVWLFLVSPPGGAKTITLSGLNDYDRAYSTSSLTPHALISGANWQGQADPSLIPRLDGKILVIKDFTSILGLRDNEKEEIFSILRDAYDGKCGKIFGNGVERTYTSHFTIIAAVTPSIYEIGSRHAALGERFLKYVMGDNLHHHQEQDIISKAIENVDQDTRIKEELTAVTSAFLQYGFDTLEVPKLDNVLHKQIIELARFGARLRGTVSRDLYNNDMMQGRPFAEVGSRLGIQLSKLARALAAVRSKPEVGHEEYLIVRKVMLDTVAQRTEDIVRTIYLRQNGQPVFLTTNDIAALTRYPITTVRRLMDDLNLLKVVERHGTQGSGYKHTWCLTDYMQKTIKESGVYTDLSPRLVITRKRRS